MRLETAVKHKINRILKVYGHKLFWFQDRLKRTIYYRKRIKKWMKYHSGKDSATQPVVGLSSKFGKYLQNYHCPGKYGYSGVIGLFKDRKKPECGR